MTFVDVSRKEIAIRKRNGDEWGGGRWKTGGRKKPSGELVSTMLTLVWAIAGICWIISGATRSRGGMADGIAYVGRHVEDE
jgi:hypothetical protein